MDERVEGPVDNPRLRVSSLGVLCWQADQLVWHDTLAHRRFALGAGAEEVLRCFTTWQPVSRLCSRARDKDDARRLLAIAGRLRTANVLITWDSDRHWVEEASQTAFKTSASGGGRHPTELYLHAHHVDGLRPGLYHLKVPAGGAG